MGIGAICNRGQYENVLGYGPTGGKTQFATEASVERRSTTELKRYGNVLGNAPTGGKAQFATKASQVGHTHKTSTAELVVYLIQSQSGMKMSSVTRQHW